MRRVEIKKITFYGPRVRIRLKSGEAPVALDEEIEIVLGSTNIRGKVIGVDKHVVTVDRSRVVEKGS